MKNFKLISFLTLSAFFINCLILSESGSIIDPTYYNYQYSAEPSVTDSDKSEVDSQNQLQLLLRDCFTNCLLDLEDENCSGIVLYKSLNPIKKSYEYFCRLSNPKTEKDILISRGTRVALGISDRDNKDLDIIDLDDLIKDKIESVLSRTKRDDIFPIPTVSINNGLRKRRSDSGQESTTLDSILDPTIFPSIVDDKSIGIEGLQKVAQKSPKKVTTDEIISKNQIHFPVSTEFPLFAHIAKTSPKIPKVIENPENSTDTSHLDLQPTTDISTEKVPLTSSTFTSNQVANPDFVTEVNSEATEKSNLELSKSSEKVPLADTKENSTNPTVAVDQEKDTETEINSDSDHTEKSQLELSKSSEKVPLASTGITTTEKSSNKAGNHDIETEINSNHNEKDHLELTSSTEKVPLSTSTTEKSSNLAADHEIETEINSAPTDHTVKNHLEMTSSTEKVQTILSTKSPEVIKPETELPAIITGTGMDTAEKEKLGESFKKVVEHFTTTSPPTTTTTSTSSTESFKELNKEILLDEEKVHSTTPSTATTPVSPEIEVIHEVNPPVIKPVEPTGHDSESGESQKITTTENPNFFIPETTTTFTSHSDSCNISSEMQHSKDLDILFQGIDTNIEDEKNCTEFPTTTEHEIYGIGSISAFPDSITLPNDENISTTTAISTTTTMPSPTEIPTSTSYTVEQPQPPYESEVHAEHENIHNEIPEMFNEDDEECLNEDHERFKRNILATTYALIEGKPSMLTFESGSNCFSILRKGEKHAILKSLHRFLPEFPKNSHIIAAGYFNDKVFLFDDSSDQRAWILPTNLLRFGLSPTKSLETISKSEFLQNYCGFLPEDFNFSEITIRAIAQYSLNDSSCILFDKSNFPIITPNASDITNSLGKSISYLLSTEYVNYPEAFFAWLDEPEVSQVYLFGSNGELYSLYRNITLSEFWHNQDYEIIPYEQFPL